MLLITAYKCPRTTWRKKPKFVKSEKPPLIMAIEITLFFQQKSVMTLDQQWIRIYGSDFIVETASPWFELWLTVFVFSPKRNENPFIWDTDDNNKRRAFFLYMYYWSLKKTTSSSEEWKLWYHWRQLTIACIFNFSI